MNYMIAPDGKSITCGRCGYTSHNANDVKNLYCGECNMFHDELETKRAADFKPGDIPVFIPGHHPGAIENGVRIVKVWGEPGDSTPVGTKGVVLSSVGHPTMGIAYFIAWDTMPNIPVFAHQKKIGRT